MGSLGAWQNSDIGLAARVLAASTTIDTMAKRVILDLSESDQKTQTFCVVQRTLMQLHSWEPTSLGKAKAVPLTSIHKILYLQ